MDVESLYTALRDQIESGSMGPSGSRFFSVRACAAAYDCAYVTAFRAFERLRENHLLMLMGREHYVTTGVCAHDTPLYEQFGKRCKRICGLLVNELNNSYYTQQIVFIQNRLREHGYDLLVMMNESDMDLECKQLKMLLEMGTSGILYFPHSKFKNLAIYEHCPLPVIALGRRIQGFTRSTISVNNNLVGRLAALHLIGRGYEDFLYIGIKQYPNMVDERGNAFEERFIESQISFSSRNIFYFDPQNLTETLQKLSRRIAAIRVPTGVFCYHDNIAVELLRLCVMQGIDVPNQIGIIGCDNLDVTLSTTPKLSTLSYPYDGIAELAVETLLQEIESGQSNAAHINISPEVIARQSTLLKKEAPPPASNRSAV